MKVLVVDDEPEVRNIITEALEEPRLRLSCAKETVEGKESQ